MGSDRREVVTDLEGNVRSTQIGVDGAIYVVWSPDRQCAYVGESDNYRRRRDSHYVALALGCTFETVKVFPGRSAKRDRLRVEAETIRKLQRRGVTVVNRDKNTVNGAGRDDLPHNDGGCAHCGAVLSPRRGGGVPRKYCDDRCRREAWAVRVVARLGGRAA